MCQRAVIRHKNEDTQQIAELQYNKYLPQERSSGEHKLMPLTKVNPQSPAVLPSLTQNPTPEYYFQDVVAVLSQPSVKSSHKNTMDGSFTLDSERIALEMEGVMKKLQKDKCKVDNKIHSAGNASKIKELARSLEKLLMDSFSELLQVRKTMEMLGIE